VVAIDLLAFRVASFPVLRFSRLVALLGAFMKDQLVVAAEALVVRALAVLA
jgi:hypothetical protein